MGTRSFQSANERRISNPHTPPPPPHPHTHTHTHTPHTLHKTINSDPAISEHYQTRSNASLAERTKPHSGPMMVHENLPLSSRQQCSQSRVWVLLSLCKLSHPSIFSFLSFLSFSLSFPFFSCHPFPFIFLSLSLLFNSPSFPFHSFPISCFPSSPFPSPLFLSPLLFCSYFHLSFFSSMLAPPPIYVCYKHIPSILISTIATYIPVHLEPSPTYPLASEQ